MIGNVLEMKINLKIKLITLALAGIAVAVPSLAAPLTDYTKSCRSLVNKSLKTPNPPLKGMKEKVSKRLNKALELQGEGKYDEAIAKLKAIVERSSDNYVKSIVSLNIASAYSQLSKYDQALPYFVDSLKFGEGQLDNARLQDLRYNVAMLFYSKDRKKEAKKLLNEWLAKSNKDDSKVYYLLAVIRVNEGKHKEAACPAYFAVKFAKEPKKTYYNTMLVSHYELKDFKGSIEILKEMVVNFPQEKSYWIQLASLYSQTDKFAESLAIMEMLYLQDRFDKESDYKQLASLFAYQDVPYRSAQILEEGINKGIVKPEENNWKNVANNYRYSNELDKAIIAYGRTAEVADSGEYYLSQGELYMEKEGWKSAISALTKAIRKGKLDDKGRAYYRKGIALGSSGKCSDSIKALRQAAKFKLWSKPAKQGIAFFENRIAQKKCR